MRAAAGLLAAIAGCARVPGAPVDLVAMADFARVPLADDPFADEADAPGDCAETTGRLEDFGGAPAFEIDGLRCVWLTVTQPARVAASPGDWLQLRLWHFRLDVAGVSEAVIAVAVDGVERGRARVALPAEAGMELPQWRVEQGWEAGAPVMFHLHNHGENTYHLLDLDLVPLVPAGSPEAADPADGLSG